MKKSEYVKSVRELNAQIEELRKAREELCDKYAVEHCPFKVGDVIPIVGYVHRNKQGRVTEVFGSGQRYDEIVAWVVRGNVLKKDGSDSLLAFSFDEVDYSCRGRRV